ncbi:UpxY family transcription antiterminator [Spirosoma agri]|uniref:UpxY family transcription antiterminator n=1 Tax=Spirosoma agri TaxID=1987381 RepID=UPI001478D01F|nr:UpxY family transcription antiterminator [Spirosoma agri]
MAKIQRANRINGNKSVIIKRDVSRNINNILIIVVSIKRIPWFVLYIKSRNEKLVAEKLRQLDIEVYCPVIKTQRKWSDRIKVVEEPQFRSYCFVKLPEPERNRVFAVPGIVRYLYWLNKPAIVRDVEIEAIQLMLNEVDNNQLKLTRLETGSRAKICSGTFAQREGIVMRQEGKITVIMLEILDIMISVDYSKTIIRS